MQQKCIICDGKEFHERSKLLIECRGCGLIKAKDIPSPQELARLYQREYFFGKEYFDYKLDRPALEHNFKKRLKQHASLFNEQANLVEVGCAYGFFLNLAKDRVATHTGYDVSKDGVKFAKNELKVNALTEDFLSAKIPEGSVDIVCMWDVIEHLHNPDQYIAKISKILAPEGTLLLTTGDISGVVPRMRGDKWRMIHPPTHLYYFSPETMRKLLKKHGMLTTSVRYPTMYRNYGSIIKQIDYNQKAQAKSGKVFEGVYAVSNKIGLTRLNIPVNTFDIMEVGAVKQ